MHASHTPASVETGKPVDARGLHGLSCRKSSPMQQRHSSMMAFCGELWNGRIDSGNKGTGEFDSANGKRPDGSTLIPWSRGKPMAWDVDVTVPDTYADTHLRHCHRGRCSGEPVSGQQNRQIWWTGQHANLPPSCQLGYLESLGGWACPGNWQTGHINHWRTQRIHLSVSAVVNSPPKGKCCRLPQHFWLRDAVSVIPWLVQFLACGFVLVIIIIIIIQ